ncbi:MAG: MFS transporter [Steroidobacteraceae bacterium]
MKARGPSQLALALYRRELLPWALAGCTLGLVEGATAAVLVKRGFADLVQPEVLNLAVAFVSGSPALANMTSFLWANLAHGREKVRLLVWLLAVFGVAVGVMGLAPRASIGLTFTLLAVLAARVIWAGVLTVRAAVWSSNYPRANLAQITGRIVVATSAGMVVTAAIAGLVLQTQPQQASRLYIVAGVTGLLAAWLCRRVRVRQSFRLRQAEQGEGAGAEIFSLKELRNVLRTDPDYRRFMTWQALYGAGNLMITGQLVILFTDQLHLPAAQQVGMLTIVPLLCVPLFTPVWARLFDSGHVIDFRARQCWSLVAAMSVAIAAIFLGYVPLLWCSALLFGVATAGASLGWNLGHNDFASLGKAQHYMGVNVTLTGMRGLIAPPLGALTYTLLERQSAGAGRYALLLPLGLTVSGAIGFTRMKLARTGPLRT